MSGSKDFVRETFETGAVVIDKLRHEVAWLKAELDHKNQLLESTIVIADRWMTAEQKLHGDGGAGAEIRRLLGKEK